jgi:hypothetical protein
MSLMTRSYSVDRIVVYSTIFCGFFTIHCVEANSLCIRTKHGVEFMRLDINSRRTPIFLIRG